MKKLLAILLILCFATPALAQNWHFYGSVRMHAGFFDVAEDFVGGPQGDPGIRADDSEFLLSLQNNSRFGARVQASDNLFALLETAVDNPGGNNIDLRLFYANWNFGAGNLIVGQDYTPATFLGYSNMIGDLGNVDAIMLVNGLPYISRQPQIKLQMGDFSVAMIERASNVPTSENHTPRIEAAYVFRTPMVNVRPVVGFQSLDNTAIDETITSFLVGLGASFDFNPAYLKTTASFTQNPREYGQIGHLRLMGTVPAAFSPTGDNLPLIAVTSDGDDDIDLIMATLVVGYNISPDMRFEAGVGYSMWEFGDIEQDSYVAYAQLPIILDKGITFTPEVGYVNHGDIETPGGDIDQGDMTYVAAQLRFDF